MTCRRAFELDVPAFVVDPRDPAWDDFRAHYPRCADCAAEVAAWSALQATLGERHPEPEDLLRWHDAPDSLSGEARDTVARHVARCASCRDELRALGGFAPAAVSGPRATEESSNASDAARDATDAVQAHHPSASRAGGRHAERHAFARTASARTAPHDGATAGRTRADRRRGPVARVVLHPAFAYAVLALVLLLPTVRTALDHDAKRAAFDAGATHPAAPAPDEPQPITAGSRRLESGRNATDESRAGAPQDARRDRTAPPDDAPSDRTAAPDDARVDRTAPRLMRQAPFRPAPPEAPAPAAQPPAEVAPAAKAAVPLAEGELARGKRAAQAPAAAGAVLQDAVSSADAAGTRAPGGGAAGPSLRLLPPTADGARPLVATLPASASAAADVEVRVVDASGGRELRQRVARAPGAGADVQIALPAGFTAPVLRVEIYADGAGPLLQGSVTP